MDSNHINKEAQRLWALLCKQHNKQKSMPQIDVRRSKRNGSSGTYHHYEHRITLTLGVNTADAWETLAHELVHGFGFLHHNRKFYHELKQLVECRWKTRISSYDWNKYGYACDFSISAQLNEKGCVKF